MFQRVLGYGRVTERTLPVAALATSDKKVELRRTLFERNGQQPQEQAPKPVEYDESKARRASRASESNKSSGKQYQPAYNNQRSTDEARELRERAERAASASTSSSESLQQRGRASAAGMSAKQADQASAKPARVPRVPLAPLPIVRENDGDKGTFFSGESYKKLGASSEIIAALKSLGITRPSHVQAQAYQALLDGEVQHLMVADQAGSGKTLAYLLPLIQLIRADEAAAGKPLTQPHCPRVVILAPTTELVQQVYRVVKAVSGAGVPFRSAIMTGGESDHNDRGRSYRTQVQQLAAGLDVLVCTPGRALEHLKKGNLDLSCCKAVVLDEVDVLLGDNAAFKDQVVPLQEAAPPSMRFVLVTATIPQHTLAQLSMSFPNIGMAMGPGLHRTAAGLKEELIDCSGGEEVSLESGTRRKLEALTEAISKHKAGRVLVFCNKIGNCRAVENYLQRCDPKQQQYKVLVYHEAIRDDLRAQAINAFLAPKKADEVPLVLIATDRMSRGIDSMYCEHVVLFDFPRDPSEYVRRVGRTARGAGGTGVVSALVLGRQVPLAREIMQRNEKGMPVHRVPLGV